MKIIGFDDIRCHVWGKVEPGCLRPHRMRPGHRRACIPSHLLRRLFACGDVRLTLSLVPPSLLAVYEMDFQGELSPLVLRRWGHWLIPLLLLLSGDEHAEHH